MKRQSDQNEKCKRIRLSSRDELLEEIARLRKQLCDKEKQANEDRIKQMEYHYNSFKPYLEDKCNEDDFKWIIRYYTRKIQLPEDAINLILGYSEGFFTICPVCRQESHVPFDEDERLDEFNFDHATKLFHHQFCYIHHEDERTLRECAFCYRLVENEDLWGVSSEELGAGCSICADIYEASKECECFDKLCDWQRWEFVRNTVLDKENSRLLFGYRPNDREKKDMKASEKWIQSLI